MKVYSVLDLRLSAQSDGRSRLIIFQSDFDDNRNRRVAQSQLFNSPYYYITIGPHRIFHWHAILTSHLIINLRKAVDITVKEPTRVLRNMVVTSRL